VQVEAMQWVAARAIAREFDMVLLGASLTSLRGPDEPKVQVEAMQWVAARAIAREFDMVLLGASLTSLRGPDEPQGAGGGHAVGGRCHPVIRMRVVL
jgi:hypothetical protein